MLRPGRSLRRPPVVLVTAGPTREHLDDVRFLSNGSTGRMGIALAEAALRAGCRVRLVLGPTELEPPPGVTTTRVTSAREMLAATRSAARGADIVIFSAAPADWAPARRARGKPPKGSRGLTLRLVPTPDIAAALARTKGKRIHVGFALESGAGELARALAKLVAKRFDAVVLNSPANLGRGGGLALWITTPGLDPAPRIPVADVESLPTTRKDVLARAILARTFALR
jgi:phosphopantothenoylcysteine decarboxylase/phosphopantothenate--cysteine ligase